ncbi:hypothetical protein [Microtetraspora sp. NBRC 13810]|uniref:hypothetical protein n=1 Tax=Microtetraspora sp. NBRC 13810 TaxID=3030990 RepID=UPI002556D140|nr:hypothetical protein [Microtetraspora sp. NBRC 13810]
MSPHVSLARRDHMRLVWQEPYHGVERVRVLLWTCDCRATVYELCQAGGQTFLRRTLRFEKERQVHETYRWTFAQAYEIWVALLCGAAR